MHCNCKKSYFVEYVGSRSSADAIDSISELWNVFTSITNHFIGVDVQLSKISLNGYESVGFDVRSLTQDRDQEQFTITITTQMPIPLAIYDDRYTWAKYGCLILPQVLKLNEVQNYTIRGMYHYFLRDFLRVD